MANNGLVIAGLFEDLEFAARVGNDTARARGAALKLQLNALSSIRTLAKDKLARDSGNIRDWKEAMLEIAGLCNSQGQQRGSVARKNHTRRR